MEEGGKWDLQASIVGVEEPGEGVSTRQELKLDPGMEPGPAPPGIWGGEDWEARWDLLTGFLGRQK